MLPEMMLRLMLTVEPLFKSPPPVVEELFPVMVTLLRFNVPLLNVYMPPPPVPWPWLPLTVELFSVTVPPDCAIAPP